jgi:Zn-finger nucleic acid-binding protein
MATPLACPRCSTQALVENRGARIAAHACPACGGVWLGSSLAGRLQHALEHGEAIGLCDLARDAGELAALKARCEAAVDRVGIPCPACTAPMTHSLLERAGIVVDTCPLHGTWFDRGELQHLVDCTKDPRVRERFAARAASLAPSAASSARTGTGRAGAAAAVGAAAVGVAGVAAAGALVGSPAEELQRQALQGDGGGTGGSVLEGAAEVASDVVDVGDVVEGVADAGSSLLDIISSLFDW